MLTQSATRSQQHYRATSLREPPESLGHWAASRTAYKLAWERHNYYQRLQREEEELALKMRREQQRRNSRQYHHQNKAHAARQTHQDTVARTGSLNRLASRSQLSVETSRVLGLCRSNTLSAAMKKMSRVKMDPASRAATPSAIRVNDDEAVVVAGPYAQEGDFAAASSLDNPSPNHVHKKTLKNHLAPQLRSLARRCSSRFSSRRSNSALGSGTDSSTDRADRRRSTESVPASAKSAHMCDFKPLKAGPETIEIQKQMEREALIKNILSERVPVHRTVSLSRSDTVPTRDTRRSLRFANGRGMDYSSFVKPEDAKLDSMDAMLATIEREELSTSRGTSTSLSSVSETVSRMEEHESVKREILAFLSLGRKGTRRSPPSSRSKCGTAPVSAPSSIQCLSPLAVEAQEDISESTEEDGEEELVTAGVTDPCAHVAFMLVPKSRYEFQPLVM
ncbi:hypothetical protein BGX28_007809 [Mortierella sp. GBA30]|nr:hypothetical protein BGX28_007809 [Mortierella sp. GBA30]